MAYRQYNSRGRYNNPGQFVPAGEQPPEPPTSYQTNTPNQNLQTMQMKTETTNTQEMKSELDDMVSKQDDPARPSWMKTKLAGFKKTSNKERRRRQNAQLRRLLTPKNAVMVLNEMMPNEHITNQYKVEPTPVSYYQQPNASFCADLTLQGATYKGYGENKMMARNKAAEQAVRDLVLKKMNKLVNSDSESVSGDGSDEDVLPMIQLASFALHKLFCEWEYEGHRVPQLRPNTSNSMCEAMEGVEDDGAGEGSEGGGAAGGKSKSKAKGPKALPLNASSMHPCMLLTYMRANLEYREVSAEGDRPQTMLYTASIQIDDNTYVGTGSNKKEARKNAAKAACEALFGVTFDAKPTCNMPIPANK